jgi:hypothetical protein
MAVDIFADSVFGPLGVKVEDIPMGEMIRHSVPFDSDGMNRCAGPESRCRTRPLRRRCAAASRGDGATLTNISLSLKEDTPSGRSDHGKRSAAGF